VPSLTAVRTAAAAQAWLAQAGPNARVLNAFDHACNLVDGDGQVLALVTAERGLTPFGLVIAAAGPAPFAGVDAESGVTVRPGWLHVGPLAINCASALPWDARPGWPAIQATLVSEPDRLARLAALSTDLAPAASLLGLFAARDAARSGLSPALFTRAYAAATDLVAGLSTGNMTQAEAGALRLAGVGGGLTPAGDDFALGVFLAAHAGLHGRQAAALCPALVAAMRPRTTTLSAAYLQAAAHGECASYWHAVLAAVSAPDGPSPALPAAVQALVSVGHTSGADGLAGFLAAFALAPPMGHRT
jgi:hypothetical protein